MPRYFSDDFPSLHGHSQGIRPVTVQFEKHSDRNAVLNKAHTLAGTGIFISEDFPRLNN